MLYFFTMSVKFAFVTCARTMSGFLRSAGLPAGDGGTPVVFCPDGGGGRPGDVDADRISVTGLDVTSFAHWAAMNGRAPRIAVNTGRCFAGNAVIFGLADITVATTGSNIGLGGPAMIEGGGLGVFDPRDVGPLSVQHASGVVDIVVADEAGAVALPTKYRA